MAGKSSSSSSYESRSSTSIADLLSLLGHGIPTDEYKSLKKVIKDLADAGLESSNLIVGIDFTKSNEWTGARSFNGKSLHHIGDSRNPYEQAISIIGKTLALLNKDKLIPCFGFGDITTHDQDVFSFYSDETPCNGFDEMLCRYWKIIPHLRLAGPTSFAPIIEKAMNIVEQSGRHHHTLVIIADGQVTRGSQELKTVNAIAEASKFALSIILVGVGDGPWDMKEFVANIPARDFDNFQFVDFTHIMTKDIPASQKEAAFAVAALKKIPLQYKTSLELNLLGGKANAPYRRALLPPPIYDSSSSDSGNSSPVGTTQHPVTEHLAGVGIESSNLIVGIDFTKSNEWTGARSFNRLSLHHIGDGPNPYQQAISVIGKTLAAFDEDNLIPCFGFGDATTLDQDVFSFFYDHRRFCNGFEEVLSRYREIVPHVHLAAPTSFAPIIEMAMTIVEESGGQYHVLVIIADGQVTRSIDTECGKLSTQEQKTVEAIVKASKLPLSIILVGVGDGPWDLMKQFGDNIPDRDFNNFHFVNFTEIMLENISPSEKEKKFADAALMGIVSQYKSTIEHKLLGNLMANAPVRDPLPPPTDDSVSSGNQLCTICYDSVEMAYECGQCDHQICRECGENLEKLRSCCPFCRGPIITKIKLN